MLVKVATVLTENADTTTEVVEDLTKWQEFQNHCAENVYTYVVVGIIAVTVIWALPKVIRFVKNLIK